MLTYESFTNLKLDEDFYKEIYVDFFNTFYESMLTIDEKNEIESYVSLNENFFDKLKDRYDKSKEVVKNVSDQAKKSLEKIIDAAKDATDFVKSMVENISNTLKTLLSKTKDKIVDTIKNSDDIVNKIKEHKDNSDLIDEMKQAKDLVTFYNDKFIKTMIDKVKSCFNQVVTKENELAVVEKNIDNFKNPKNMISKLIHGLESIPPFSWLDAVKEMGEKNINRVFDAISTLTTKMGGPKFELPIIAGILAIVIETKVKGLVKHGLLELVGFYTIPYVTILIKVVGWIATFISLVLVIDLTLGLNIMEHH